MNFTDMNDLPLVFFHEMGVNYENLPSALCRSSLPAVLRHAKVNVRHKFVPSSISTFKLGVTEAASNVARENNI
jgi:hypothetical protein